MPPVSQTWKGSPVSDFYEEKDADQSTHEVEIEESEDEIDELDKDTVSDDLSLLIPTGSILWEKPPEFCIPFVVPYHNALCHVDGITSRTSLTQALHIISNCMDVLLTLLAEISYIPSYLPKFSKPCPMLLEDEVSWQKLLDSISNFIVSCQEKNGKGTIKPFHINIVDMNLTTSPSDTDIKKKKKTATTEEPSAPALTSRESAQILASKKLKTHHMCQQHKKPCIIQSDGKHYQLMMNEITKWAHLMHSAKKALAKSQVYNAGLPDWMEKLVGMMFVGNMATNNQVMSLATNPPTIPMPLLHPTFMQPPDTQAPAPAPIHPASPLNYPMVNPWLVSLETHPIQGKKAQKFTCHAESLSANGIDNLEDLLHLTSTELMSIIPNINIGIAKGLLAFAEEDVSSLYEHKQVHLM